MTLFFSFFKILLLFFPSYLRLYVSLWRNVSLKIAPGGNMQTHTHTHVWRYERLFCYYIRGERFEEPLVIKDFGTGRSTVKEATTFFNTEL